MRRKRRQWANSRIVVLSRKNSNHNESLVSQAVKMGPILRAAEEMFENSGCKREGSEMFLLCSLSEVVEVHERHRKRLINMFFGV